MSSPADMPLTPARRSPRSVLTLRRARRRSDLARKLRSRDAIALALGAVLGVVGLLIPRALEAHAPQLAQSAVGSMSDLEDPDAPLVLKPGQIALDRARDGMFYADLLINGKKVHFLVDTGASVVTLTSTDARRLGIRPGGKAGGVAATSSGRTRFRWAELERVDIGTHRINEVKAAVLSGDSGVSLLGQNLLSRIGGVRIEKDKLILG